MAISFDKALGILPKALVLQDQRSQVLAANLANADTPNFKARDLEFESMLRREIQPNANQRPVRLASTHAGHIRAGNELNGGSLLYRNPNQPSLDGNTVEEQVEQAKYAENALRYQASLRFINGTFSGLSTAIRGEIR
ncbi:MAG: flagellar basal body rod protein FlgB [Methylococcales bacterium]|nr:flagellar basal body rod protein FlgB [Methylococcales bacterium]